MANQKSAASWDAKAKNLAERERWGAAARALTNAARVLPHDAARWKQIAEWQMRGGDLPAAIQTLESAIELNRAVAPDAQEAEVELWLALAETQMAAQNWQLAAQACGELLRLMPRHHAALELLATALLQTNQLEPAVEVMRDLLQLSPRDPLHRLKLATLLQLQGKLGEASREFQRVLELYPEMPFAEDAAEAVDSLDRIQTQQILMLAAEKTEFRINLQRRFDVALLDGGFYLSENGRESLRHMIADIAPDDRPPTLRAH